MLASACWSALLARAATHRPPSFVIFNPAEVEELAALTGTILPETDTPGAKQAGVVHFIDAAIAGFDRDQLLVYRRGLADVELRTRQMFPPATRFSDVSESQRTALLQSIEKTAFFEKLREHTILAYFGNPEFGWKLVGRDSATHFDPPFGFYDAESRAK